MSLCILAGAKTTALAIGAFTLSWVHSVEKVTWEEDWRVTPAGLHIVEARIKGSGAGMEPPEDAILDQGWWRYRPELGTVPELVLARSGSAGQWTLCGSGTCPLVLAESGDHEGPVILRPCK